MKNRNVSLLHGLDEDARWNFALKMLIGLAWFGVAFGGAVLLRQEPFIPRLAGLTMVALPPLLWLLHLQRQARVDELEARLALVAQAQGCWWAVSFGALLYGIAVFQGDDMNGVLLALLPAGAYFFGECMAQVARAALHRKSGPD